MSYGLMCLECRKYLVEQPDTDWACSCEKPRPSWDAKTEAHPDTLPEWCSAHQPSEGE